MLRLIGFLVFVGLAVAGSVWMADRPGDVTVQWLGWRVDTSVPILLLCVGLLLVALAALLRLVLSFLRIPGLVSRFSSRRALRNGLNPLADATAALITGDAKNARKKAEHARGLLADKGPATLILARAALLSGDSARARTLHQLLVKDKAMALAGLKGLMELAEADGDDATAADLAAQAVARDGRCDWAVRALFAAECKTAAWDAAQRTLDQGRKSGVFSDEERDRLTATLLCLHTDAAAEKNETFEATRFAKKAVSTAPTYGPAIIRLARSEAAEGNMSKAAAVLEEQWRRAPHAALGQAYMALWSDLAPLEQVRKAESLAERNPEHLESRLIVAAAAQKAGLWGQARGRLKGLLAVTPVERRAALMMASIEEADGGSQQEITHLLRVALETPIGPASVSAVTWSCGACNDTIDHWAPLCPTCGAFGTLGWGSGRALMLHKD
jgi:HemY protein